MSSVEVDIAQALLRLTCSGLVLLEEKRVLRTGRFGSWPLESLQQEVVRNVMARTTSVKKSRDFSTEQIAEKLSPTCSEFARGMEMFHLREVLFAALGFSRWFFGLSSRSYGMNRFDGEGFSARDQGPL